MPDNDALLLIAHGSERLADAGRIVLAHAERVRQARPGRQVSAALLNGAPSVAQALADLTAPVIRVVPFFMEDGYFTKICVPRALAEAAGSPGRQIRLAPPVGIHEKMAALIADCAVAGCARHGLAPDRMALLIVGHGSARAPGRALALHAHAERLRQARQFAQVNTACLEEPPFMAHALRELRGYVVGVVGFFAGEGGHVRDDVPGLIAAEQAARGPNGARIYSFGSAADNPDMLAIIMSQAGNA